MKLHSQSLAIIQEVLKITQLQSHGLTSTHLMQKKVNLTTANHSKSLQFLLCRRKITDGTVKAYNSADKAVKEFTGLETATFKFTAANQSGKAMNLPTGYSHIEASFTVFNDGANDITVNGMLYHQIVAIQHLQLVV